MNGNVAFSHSYNVMLKKWWGKKEKIKLTRLEEFDFNKSQSI